MRKWEMKQKQNVANQWKSREKKKEDIFIRYLLFGSPGIHVLQKLAGAAGMQVEEWPAEQRMNGLRQFAVG